MAGKGALIKEVIKDSIAFDTGIEKGDLLISINETPVRDYIDYRYLSSEENLSLHMAKVNGEEWVIDIEKDYDDELGIIFDDNAFGGIRPCANRCLFCFIDQMPPGMRESLYVKDDDYRYSFLQGNFITLTNLSAKDIQRIVDMRLSPLYISVHTTDPELRNKMLGNKKAGQIMETLRTFKKAGIEMHTQLVLCPGINDGINLEHTINDLASLWPAVASIAVVPVGLTGYRENMYRLKLFQADSARDVLDIIHKYQEKFIAQKGFSFVYAADEFYLLAGYELPAGERYDDYPQTENGVGLARIFLDSFNAEKLPARLGKTRTVTLATGFSGGKVLATILDRLNQIENLQVKLEVIRNKYFGETVTVSGLVTASDIKEQLVQKNLGDALIIPSVMLKKDEDVFLDGTTVEELSRELVVKVLIVDMACGAKDFIKKVTGGA